MKKSKPAEYKRNSYSDDDMRELIREIEELEAEKISIRAEAAGKCGGIAKKIAVVKGRAKDLAIPLSILSGLLKTRKLERQIEAVGQGIPDDLAEVWEDATGQFSFIAPAGDEPSEPGETATQAAARKRKAEADQHQQEEQAEGEKVLDELAQVH